MLTIFVEIIMGGFIANFRASEHPIINLITRGVLIGITLFFLGLFSSILSGSNFSFIFALKVCLLIGLGGTLWISLIEYIFGKKSNK
ncbi:hypothetical protein M5F00_08895 [Acinetobacter sp. ANC 4945]|uniref:Uncharacterized protein n=1 Tax=Acinetobacter amyesii TaxID=2942470 RepID=A0A1T1GUD9_9GAMM|nr:hypothetical protein [Acinetobacter amyesii]MCL6247976.1 hypothetical protein [Acinetobacter amyesii]OOV81188.1 hypothetical protein B1202_11545 [Acinetobacter amyesii]